MFRQRAERSFARVKLANWRAHVSTETDSGWVLWYKFWKDDTKSMKFGPIKLFNPPNVEFAWDRPVYRPPLMSLGLIILEIFSLVWRKMYDTKKMQLLWFIFDWKFFTSAIKNRLKLNVPPAWILSFYNNNQFLAKIVTFSMLKRLQKYKISCKMNVGVFICGLFTAIHSLHFIFRG